MASDSGRKLSSRLTASPRHQEAWTWPAFYFTINLEWRGTRYNIKPFIDPKWLRKLVFQLRPFIDVELCQQNEGAMVVTTTRHTEVKMKVCYVGKSPSLTLAYVCPCCNSASANGGRRSTNEVSGQKISCPTSCFTTSPPRCRYS
jgi:hypothetical protein